MKNIKYKCLKAIREDSGAKNEQIFSVFHYFPNYWHLHVHFKYRTCSEMYDSFFCLQKYIGKLSNPNYTFPKNFHIYCPFPELTDKLPQQTVEEKERFKAQSKFKILKSPHFT